MTRFLPLALLALTACGPHRPDVSRFIEPRLLATGEQQVDLTRPEICQSRDETPAVIETVTETHEDETGALRTETRQRIVENREEIWFDTPCRDAWTPQFIESIQRALIVRGFLGGAPNGEMTSDTRRAIRAFQRVEGINSDVLSIAAGKRLGLIVYDRAEALAE